MTPASTRATAAAAVTAVSAGEAAFHALSAQVGGHPGVMESQDGALIIKVCLPDERTFYELLANEDARVARLQPFVPLFYGTLRLEGRVSDANALTAVDGVAAASGTLGVEHGIVPAPEIDDKDRYSEELSVVLENIASSFTKPNILDIKLGTILHDDAASAEKKGRMMETAKNTTSLETGVRLTGFQVYDHTKGAPSVTPKSYGRTITATDLPEGIRRFFPLSPFSSAEVPAGQGLPRTLLLPVLAGVLADVRALREALAATELRMVGGSLLIVYEADWAKSQAGLGAVAAKAAEGADDARDSKVEEAGYEEDDDDDDEEKDDDDEDEEDIDGPAYAVKLIDFAHTKLMPGKGPDESVLKGIDTTISLLEGRIKEIESQ